jgi:protein MpaA
VALLLSLAVALMCAAVAPAQGRAADAGVTASGLTRAVVPTTTVAVRSVVGRSFHNRAILAYQKGRVGAPHRMLVVGSIHGDETAGLRVVERLLKAPVPIDVELWVVPTINPDGVALKRRGNWHRVDLNRNFPDHWVRRGAGTSTYSGPSAASEPETRIAMALIRKIRPEVTVWIHQPLYAVDFSGGNPVITRRLATLSGFPARQLGRYPGTATGWQNHTFPGTTALTFEFGRTASTARLNKVSTALLQLARTV